MGQQQQFAQECKATCVQVRMGFPQRSAEGAAGQAFVGQDGRLQAGGFTCPRCKCALHSGCIPRSHLSRDIHLPAFASAHQAIYIHQSLAGRLVCRAELS